MFGGNAAAPAPADPNAVNIQSSENRFSLVELRRIHTQLVENKRVNDENKNLVVEILRIIAEMVVYGDNKSELLFDFFCEKNMLSLFLEIMWTEGGCPAVVHIQILQTLSILINCVRNDTSLYYLLSNNYINEIIIYPFALETDENLCDQFASFMKSLSLKLNIQTVQFFFIEETGAFPILTRAIGLLDYSEPMVRISSQSTILNVYKVEDSRAREYALQEEVMHTLFTSIVNLMKTQHSTILGISLAYQTETDETKQNKLENQMEDILASTEDWFYYLQDIMDLKILILRQALIHHLMEEFVYPILLQPLQKYETVANKRVSTDSVGSGSTGGSASGGGHAEHLLKALDLAEDSKDGGGHKRKSSSGHSKSLLEGLMKSSSPSSGAMTAAALESKEQSTTLLTMNVALMYFLQMMRFFTDPLMQRAALVSLYHPLSQSARKTVIADIQAANALKAANAGSAGAVPTASGTASGGGSGGGSAGASNNASRGSSTEDLAAKSLLPSSAAAADEAVIVVPTTSTVHCTIEDPSVASPDNKAGDRKPLYESNPFERNMKKILAGDSQKAILTSVYWFHLLTNSLINGGNNSLRGAEAESFYYADTLSPVQIVRLLQCVSVLPQVSYEELIELSQEGLKEDTEDRSAVAALEESDAGAKDSTTSGGFRNLSKQERYRNNRNAAKKAAVSAANTFSYDPDMLSLDHFVKLNEAMHKDFVNGGSYTKQTPLLEVYMTVLRQPRHYSLTSFQVVAHSVYTIANLIYSAYVDISKSKPQNNGVTLLKWLLDQIRVALKSAAQVLLDRTSGSHAENLFNLIKEEMKRYETKKWKTTFYRMLGDILNFLPGTTTNVRRMGMDFDLPISQAECVRKDIQHFLILRTLFKHVFELGRFTSNVSITAELCAGIKDQDFLYLDETNIIPHHIVDGQSYDMRGKRFLDTVIVNPVGGSGSGGANSKESHGGSSIWSTSASILTLGYLGGNRRSLPNSSSHSNSSAGAQSPTKNGGKRSSLNVEHQNKPLSLNILFIQEPTILLLISQDKTNNKIGFKVFCAVPLLFTDAKTYPDDKRKFKVVVRSWKPLPQMSRLEPEGVTASAAQEDESNNSIPGMAAINKTRRGSQSECFRKPSERSTFWTLTLSMETEQAAMLAVQHIESKRQELFLQKMNKLKSILNAWSSDSLTDALNEDN